MSNSDSHFNQLRATLSRMEIALSTIEECIVWTNYQGQIRWCNAAFERFVNQPRLLVLGTSLLNKLPLFVDTQAVSKSDHPVTIALEAKSNGKQDYTFQGSGESLVLEIAWSFVEMGNNLTEDNDSASAVLVIRNVTQQRRSELKQQKITRLLEQQVAQRTQQLSEVNAHLQSEANQLQQLIVELKETQAHLVQAEKMSSLGQLVAGIAHEINNPVNFIHGNLMYVQNYADDLLSFVQLYQKHCPNPAPEVALKAQEIDLDFLQTDFPKIVDSMQAGTERIRQIVLSLRNFSRIDEAEFKTVNIHEGIDSTLLILQHRLKATSTHPPIEVVKEYSELPPVECYPGQLNQVFMSVLTNAIDAVEELNQKHVQAKHPSPPGRITIRTSTIDPHWIRIVIGDNGAGIPEHVKNRIFDPFFTTKEIGQGTGMGMSISYRIVVEKHGGKLECFSTLGKATEFVIQLPVKQPIQH